MMTSALAAGAVLLAVGTGFLLTVGVYEGFLRRFFEEVEEQAEGSLLASTRRVLLNKLGVINRRFMSERLESSLRHQLTKAGEPADLKPEEVVGLQELAALAGLVLGIYIVAMTGWSIMIIPALILGGFYYPRIWVRDQITKRHHQITRALPYNLDLLTLSVEAGLDFTGALGKVVEKGKAGALRDEFAMVLKQLKMGKTREEALKSMMFRVDLPALSQFVTALIQADRMGTGLGKVLRIQSTQLRIERSQRAEKLANEAPVKMLFPLVACIFPTVFLVLFAPIVYQFISGGVG
jgi:tight adherence protein C